MTDLREQEMQNRIDALSNSERNLKEENQYLKEQIAQLKKMAFGSKTEKMKRVLGEGEERGVEDRLFHRLRTPALPHRKRGYLS